MRILFTLLCFSLSAFLAQANILTVSNSTVYPAQYSTIMSAVNAAVAGDTIYIYPTGPSNFYAEPININKKLVIIGGGVYADRVGKLGTWSQTSSYSLQITSAAAEGSVIMGMGFVSPVAVGTLADPVNNIMFSDCRFSGCEVYGNNIVFENNIMSSTPVNVSSYGALNIIFRNNLVYAGIGLRPGTTGILENNVFVTSDQANAALRYIQNGEAWGPGVTMRNNIFYRADIGPAAAQSPFVNNIYFLTNNPTPSTLGSSGNMNANPLFINLPPNGSTDFVLAHDFHLQASSPGKNFGTDGKDAGVWGGNRPINAFFESPLPRVIQITLSNNTIPTGGQVQLTIKATKAQ
jgi:hypothetical protein